MQEQILAPVRDVWHRHRSALLEALRQTLGELENLLRLDEYHREGHSPEHLSRSLGPFGTRALDLTSLSQVLGAGSRSRALSAERRARIEQLHQALAAIEARDTAAPPDCAVVEITEEEDHIRAAMEAHFNALAAVFRQLRIARLEIRAKYETGVHDAAFAAFDWRQLSASELRLCPPFLVLARLDGDSGPLLRKMMALLEGRHPLKIAALRTNPRGDYPATADTTVPATLALETLPLALRGVTFLQSCPTAPDFSPRLLEVLTSPRAAVISLLCREEAETAAAFARRAERAVRSRAFPLCSYDPDRARGFVSCFDLSNNPSPEELWTSCTVGTVDAHGRAAEVREPFTFAHFAADEAAFAAGFSPVEEASADSALVPLTEYLELNRRQRVGKLPVIAAPGADGTIRQLLVPPAIVTQTADRMHLWKTLQELAGLDNPHVHSTREILQSEFGARQKALLASLQTDLEERATHREQVAVADAVRKLVAHLTGTDPAAIDLHTILPTTKTADDSPEAEN
jgi:hypothetical protein